MRIGAIAAALAITTSIFWTGAASADDPSQGGPPLYCSNKAPYRVEQDNADSPWNVWMGDCYRAYELLPPGRQPNQQACAQIWDDRQGEFHILKRDEFMGICANPYPY